MTESLAIHHSFDFACNSAALVDALSAGTHIRQWWTDQGDLASEVGSTGAFHWNDRGWSVALRLERLVPGSLVEWRCMASNMQDTNAWEGSTMRFEIAADGAQGSTLKFSHIDYKASTCFEECQAGWAFVLGKSLKEYVERGQGLPYRS